MIDYSSHVSVPFRGFRGLQERLQNHGLKTGDTKVSVPFRGFRGLQGSGGRSGGRFQSPSGVLGVCRTSLATMGRVRPPRFSPLPGF